MEIIAFSIYAVMNLFYIVPLYSAELDMHTTCACQAILQNRGDHARANKIAGRYLEGARALVIRHRELTRSGELVGRDNREELARTKDDIHALQLKAADVIVQCMLPNMQILKEAFEKSDVSKHFVWEVDEEEVPKKMPIQICNDKGAGAITESWPEKNGDKGILWKVSIEIPSLLTQHGLVICGDADMLEGAIAHEIHHLIKFDSLSRNPCKNGAIETPRNREISADTFAYLYSKTACAGLAKQWVLASEEDRSILTMRYRRIHQKPKVRKAYAEQYGKNIWGIDSPSTLLENSPAERDIGIISMNKKEYIRENIRTLGRLAIEITVGWILGHLFSHRSKSIK